MSDTRVHFLKNSWQTHTICGYAYTREVEFTYLPSAVTCSNCLVVMQREAAEARKPNPYRVMTNVRSSQEPEKFSIIFVPESGKVETVVPDAGNHTMANRICSYLNSLEKTDD